MADKSFVPGRIYIARNSRMENCGLWICIKRTNSFVTFQKGTKDVRRKPIQDKTMEEVIIDEGRPWKGLRIGQQVLRSPDYKTN